MSQRDRVLQMLQAAGSRGVHTFEMRREFIGNPSQRIAELEAAGHTISHTRERLHGDATGTRYRLILHGDMEDTAQGGADPSLLGRANSQAESGPATPLFELPARQPSFDELVGPQCAINDDLDTAA